MGSTSELTHKRGNSLICCLEQDEIPWASLGREGLFCAVTQRGFRSSVTGDASKSDIELGQDKLTEMLICPRGGRIRDPMGSEDVLGKCVRNEGWTRGLSQGLSL